LEFVNRVIREMKANGKLRQLQEKYLLIPAERTEKPRGFTSKLWICSFSCGENRISFSFSFYSFNLL